MSSLLYGPSLISIFDYKNLCQKSNLSVDKGLVSKIFKQLNIKKKKQKTKNQGLALSKGIYPISKQQEATESWSA